MSVKPLSSRVVISTSNINNNNNKYDTNTEEDIETSSNHRLYNKNNNTTNINFSAKRPSIDNLTAKGSANSHVSSKNNLLKPNLSPQLSDRPERRDFTKKSTQYAFPSQCTMNMKNFKLRSFAPSANNAETFTTLVTGNLTYNEYLELPKVSLPINPEEADWFSSLMVFEGAVLKQIYVRVLLVVAVTVFLMIFDAYYHYPIPPIDSIAHSLIGLALGLLLVFRTNSAYDRFWEGRRSWSTIQSMARNISRVISSCGECTVRTGERFIDVYVALCIAVKQKLRGIHSDQELEEFLKPVTMQLIGKVSHKPLALFHLLSDYLHSEENSEDNVIDGHVRSLLEMNLNDAMLAIGACERIVNTPLPLPYIVQIRQLLFVYLMTLPVVLFNIFNIYLILPAVLMITFGLFGIEEAGHLIENPFGNDFCDLPLEVYIESIKDDMESVFLFSHMIEAKTEHDNSN